MGPICFVPTDFLFQTRKRYYVRAKFYSLCTSSSLHHYIIFILNKIVTNWKLSLSVRRNYEECLSQFWRVFKDSISWISTRTEIKSTTRVLIIDCFLNTDAASLNLIGCPHRCQYLSSYAFLLPISWPYQTMAFSRWILDSSLYVRISTFPSLSSWFGLGVPSQSSAQCQRGIRVARFLTPKRSRSDWPLTSSITLPREPSISIIDMWHRWRFSSSSAGPEIRKPSISHLSRIVFGVSSTENRPVIVCPSLSLKFKNSLGLWYRNRAMMEGISDSGFDQTTGILEDIVVNARSVLYFEISLGVSGGKHKVIQRRAWQFHIKKQERLWLVTLVDKLSTFGSRSTCMNRVRVWMDDSFHGNNHVGTAWRLVRMW